MNFKFNEQTIRENPLRVICRRKSEFGHHFGGPPRLAGMEPQTGPAFHMLLDLDLRDPLLSFLEFDRFDRLPLIFPLRYEGADLGYRLERDGSIEVFTGLDDTRVRDEWPYEDCPDCFERQPVTLEKVPYEDYKTFIFAQSFTSGFVFTDSLSDEDRLLVERQNYPFTQVGGLHHDPHVSDWQPCSNPECPGIEDAPWAPEVPMTLIASISNQPCEGISLWGELGEFVRIYYIACPVCDAIFTVNRQTG
jgi:hypothetical protein